nr:PEP-CTERM sorting domain-containing protein [uncultured Desulfuromonas sp.]
MKKIQKYLAISFTLLLLPVQTWSISLDAVTIDTLLPFYDTAGGIFGPNLLEDYPELSATSALGVFSTTDTPYPTTNLGYQYDGLLNGIEPGYAGGNSVIIDGESYKSTEVKQLAVNGTTVDYVFTGLEFINSWELQDLDKDGYKDDPGWIYLGKDETPNIEDDFQAHDAPFDLSTILDIEVSVTGGTGTWSLTPLPGITDKVENLLGGSTFFDHIAFILKNSTEFVIYDFNFNLLFGDDFIWQPYALSGTFDTKDINNDSLSYLSIWVKDPEGIQTIPEPSSLLLVGAGIMGLAIARRSKKS